MGEEPWACREERRFPWVCRTEEAGVTSPAPTQGVSPGVCWAEQNSTQPCQRLHGTSKVAHVVRFPFLLNVVLGERTLGEERDMNVCLFSPRW